MYHDYKYYQQKYGMDVHVLCSLTHLSWLGDTDDGDIENRPYFARFNINVNGKSEALILELNFQELWAEFQSYYSEKLAEDSQIPFEVFFWEEAIFWAYQMYLFHPDCSDINNPKNWMSMERLQALE